MFIHQLRMPVSAQQDAKVVKPRHNTLQFDTVDQKDRQWRFLLANMIEESVLQTLRAFWRHFGDFVLLFIFLFYFFLEIRG